MLIERKTLKISWPFMMFHIKETLLCCILLTYKLLYWFIEVKVKGHYNIFGYRKNKRKTVIGLAFLTQHSLLWFFNFIVPTPMLIERKTPKILWPFMMFHIKETLSCCILLAYKILYWLIEVKLKRHYNIFGYRKNKRKT